MTHKHLIVALLAVFMLPQQAGAFATAVYRIGNQEYMFRADNLVNPSEVGKPSGFKVKIATVDYDADPTLAQSEPVTGLAQQLRLNLRHTERNESQTVVLTETDPGLYSISFVPGATGKFVYTVAALINSTPVNVQFPCGDGQTDGAAPALDGQLAGGQPAELIVQEGSIPCPQEAAEVLVFPGSTHGSAVNQQNGAIPPDLEARLVAVEQGGSSAVTRLAFYVVTIANLALTGFLSFLIFRDMY